MPPKNKENEVWQGVAINCGTVTIKKGPIPPVDSADYDCKMVHPFKFDPCCYIDDCSHIVQ